MAEYIKREKRENVLSGLTKVERTSCGDIYITLNFNEKGEPRELFASVGKAGGCASSQCASIGRLASYFFQIGGNPLDVVRALEGVFCHLGENSCTNIIGKTIKDLLERRKDEDSFKIST